MRYSVYSVIVAGLCTLASAPLLGQTSAALCDQVSVGAFPRTAHARDFDGTFDIRSNGLVVTCGYVLPVSSSLTLVTGYSAMSFVNSFGVQSYSFGASVEAEYRPGFLDNVGGYVGIDGGFVYGYEGYFAKDRMIGPFTPAGNLKAGILYDIPDTRTTLYSGVQYVPPVFGHRGIISPVVGVTQRF